MDITPKDIVAMIALVGSFIVVALGFVTWGEVLPVILLVLAAYDIQAAFKRGAETAKGEC